MMLKGILGFGWIGTIGLGLVLGRIRGSRLVVLAGCKAAVRGRLTEDCGKDYTEGCRCRFMIDY